jgi:dienelactone hydrolase
MNPILLIISAILVLIIVLVVVVLANATVAIPKPTGSNAVGFRSITLTDQSRNVTIRGRSIPRVLTLDVWYPTLSTTGLKAEPYTEKALAKALAQFQKIPDIGGEKPSYAFQNAIIKAGLHKVIVFNHGYGSFSKQNFSNAQELASHGYLVMSIGHPGESLSAKNQDGTLLEFDDTSLSYQSIMAEQKNPKTLATALGTALDKQRKATNLTEFNQASYELTLVSPYNALESQLRDWVLDTRFVIEHLNSVEGADAKNVVLMGHSFGGTTTLELAKQNIPGVVAAINLDGAWLSYQADSSALNVPLLALLSTQNQLQGQDLGLHGTFDQMLQTNSSAAYLIEIAGTAHMNFTDLNFVPILRYLTPILGNVNTKRMANWQNNAILEFLKNLEQNKLGQALLPEDAQVMQRFFPKN